MNQQEQNMSKALDAIHDEAIKLLKHDLPDKAREKINLIISLTRYKSDVRSSRDLDK